MACGLKEQSTEKETPKWGNDPLPRKKWSEFGSLCGVVRRLPELVEDISMVSRYMQVSELEGYGVRGRLRRWRCAAGVHPWDLVQSFYSWTGWERETHCAADAQFFGYRSQDGWGIEGGISESPGRVRERHNRVRSLWDDFPSCYISAFLCSVSQSLLRLCSSVQEPFFSVMSSTAISPLLPRPRSPFRITWWTTTQCRVSYYHRGNNHSKFNSCRMFTVPLTLSRPVPHNVIWVCLQPFPPVRPQTAGLYSFPFFTNTCSMPTWWPASLCRNDRHRLPSFQGGVSGRTSRAPRPVLLFPTSGMVRYRPPGDTRTDHYSYLMNIC